MNNVKSTNCGKSGVSEKGHIQCKYCGNHVFRCKTAEEHKIHWNDKLGEYYCYNCHLRFYPDIVEKQLAWFKKHLELMERFNIP